MLKSAKKDSNFGGQKFASFRRKHELFLGPFFGCHEISENSAPVLVGEAGASVRARKSLKIRTSNRQTNKRKSPGNVAVFFFNYTIRCSLGHHSLPEWISYRLA